MLRGAGAALVGDGRDGQFAVGNLLNEDGALDTHVRGNLVKRAKSALALVIRAKIDRCVLHSRAAFCLHSLSIGCPSCTVKQNIDDFNACAYCTVELYFDCTDGATVWNAKAPLQTGPALKVGLFSIGRYVPRTLATT